MTEKNKQGTDLRFDVGGLDLWVVDLPTDIHPAFASLTEAERDLVSRVVEGESNRAIAEARGTSPSTVANQLRNVYRKLGVSSRSEVTALVFGAKG